MKIYKISDDFSDMFGNFEREEKEIIEESEPKTKIINLKLYRGFNHIPQNYILSPENSEQNVLWFTHNYISGYNPIEYAANHGKYLLSYNLKCLKHYQEMKWSNGDISTKIPEEILEKTNQFENCKYYLGLELPDGWLFSYKTEKFIICNKSIKISENMIQLSKNII